MKKLLLTYVLLLALIFSWISSFTQCNPDTIAPTFTVPDNPIFVSTWDSVPTQSEATDLVYPTLEDNCLSPDVPPWYGPTLVTSIFAQTDTSIAYRFYAYDDGINYSPYQFLIYYVDSCLYDTVPPVFIPYPPSQLSFTSILEFQLPEIEVQDNCNYGTLSILINSDSTSVQWIATDPQGNISIANTSVIIEAPSSVSILKESRLEERYEVFDINGKLCKEPLKSGFYIKVFENRVEKIIVR